MARYIAVIHGWFVSSNGFNVHELEAEDKDSANNEAVILMHSQQNTFNHCAYTIIEINERESLPRKLNLRERLTGKLGAL